MIRHIRATTSAKYCIPATHNFKKKEKTIAAHGIDLYNEIFVYLYIAGGKGISESFITKTL